LDAYRATKYTFKVDGFDTIVHETEGVLRVRTLDLADRPSEKVASESDSVPHRTETEPLPFNQAE
jgi:hypothetical protein